MTRAQTHSFTRNAFKYSLLSFALLLLGACQPARYEIVGQEAVSPTPPPCVGDECNAIPNGLPSARIVVYKGTSIVTSGNVNEPIQIKPSIDTLDPDDLVNPKACYQNPGIVEIRYLVSTDEVKTVKRTDKCEDLGLPYTFTKPGEYTIHMTAVSNENETAEAQMIFKVLDPKLDNSKEDLGFYIIVIPLVLQTGETINAQAFCKTVGTNEIAWDFGDDSTADGTVITHKYDKPGQYRISATCITKNKKYVSFATVSVVGFKLPVDPRITPPPSKPPVCPGSGQGNSGSQNSQTQQNTQTQQNSQNQSTSSSTSDATCVVVPPGKPDQTDQK